MAPHWPSIQLAHSIVTIVCICRINDFPCTFSGQHKHDEPFDVQHIHRHHLDCDPLCRELEEQISVDETKIQWFINQKSFEIVEQ